nr:NADH dehydrogenase subunit 9 [Artemidia motanka]
MSILPCSVMQVACMMVVGVAVHSVSWVWCVVVFCVSMMVLTLLVWCVVFACAMLLDGWCTDMIGGIQLWMSMGSAIWVSMLRVSTAVLDVVHIPANALGGISLVSRMVMDTHALHVVGSHSVTRVWLDWMAVPGVLQKHVLWAGFFFFFCSTTGDLSVRTMSASTRMHMSL